MEEEGRKVTVGAVGACRCSSSCRVVPAVVLVVRVSMATCPPPCTRALRVLVDVGARACVFMHVWEAGDERKLRAGRSVWVR